MNTAILFTSLFLFMALGMPVAIALARTFHQFADSAVCEAERGH